MKNILIILFAQLMFSNCNNVDNSKERELALKEKELQLKERELDLKEQTNVSKRKTESTQQKRELRYVFFSNGGIIGYFDDGTIAACSRCDFCRSNILTLFNQKPHASYTIQDDGSLLINGSQTELPEYNGSPIEGWALIDYKWHIKPPQY